MLNKRQLQKLEAATGWDEFQSQLDFRTQSDIANEKKQQLLEMARNGEPKPNSDDKLFQAFHNYTNPNGNSYDANFKKKISKVRPEWLVSQSDRASDKKEQLLEMARNGEPRPSYETHPLGRVLGFYTRNSKSNHCYDSVFNKKIRKLRPDWFVSQSEFAQEKKEQLLEMARNGDPRPAQVKHPLGVVLTFYTTRRKFGRSTYDAAFDKKIRNLRPDWFMSQTEVAQQKKEQLLEMARNGEPRPIIKKHELGLAFYTYTTQSHNCYDPVFDKKIRKIKKAQHWFKKR